MQIKRRALTAGATFFLAAATGHVMQNGGSISASLNALRPNPVAPVAEAAMTASVTLTPATDTAKPLPAINEATVVSLSADASALPTLPDAAMPALAGGQSLKPRMLKVESGYVRAASDADAAWSAFGIACADPVIVLSSRPGAMVGLHLAAPCSPSTSVRVSIDGLAFHAATDASGVLDLDLPALTATPVVTAAIQGAKPLTASAPVGDLAGLRRVAVQWTGGYDLALDAFEDGAAWGDAGHVQAGGLPSPRGAVILSLGTATGPQDGLARVYSGVAEGDAPKIEVSAEITPRTCGRILTGTILHAGATGVVTEPVSLTMPACDSLGGFVVLSVDATAQGAVSVASSGG